MVEVCYINFERKLFPLYSQFLDVDDLSWKDRSCGIICLKILIEHFLKKQVEFHKLLELALGLDAYLLGIGWKHKGLVELALKFNLKGKNFDWFADDPQKAFKKFEKLIKHHALIVSVYKNFNPHNGGHLVVVLGKDDNFIYYLEPAARLRRTVFRRVSIKKFQRGWKRRVILIKK